MKTNIKLNNHYLLQRRLNKSKNKYGISPHRTYLAVDLESEQSEPELQSI